MALSRKRHIVLSRLALSAGFYYLAGVAISILVAFALSRFVDVRVATPLSADMTSGEQTWSVNRWDTTGATQVLSIRHIGANWSPRQATGPPDTLTPGDQFTAWASAKPDVTGDWLELGYANAVVPKALKVYESFNPGAICRITAFSADGREAEAWQGTDPSPIGAPSGVSDIPLAITFPTSRVRIYLASEKVPGWNEIDAAGLVDSQGRLQWANDAKASSFYGETSGAGPSATASSPAPADMIPAWSGLDKPGAAMRDSFANSEYRIADARGWPMLALRSEREVPAAVAASISTAVSASSISVPYSSGSLTGSTYWSGPVPPITPAAATIATTTPVPLRPIWPGLAIDAALFGGLLFLCRWLLVVPARALREVSRLRRGCCIACGYDLGYDFIHGCPECGWRRSGANAPPNARR